MAGRKSTATMELAIGATIIVAIVVLVVMLMAWGNNTSFLGSHYRVVVNMSNIGGLKEGAPVKLGGFQIGRVASIQLRPGATDMEIVLDIDESRLLPKGSTTKVSTAGLVGDAFLEIVPGHSTETIRRAANIADAERLESSSAPDISELMTKVDSFGDEIILMSQSLNDIVGNDEFRRNVKDLAINLNALTLQANQILHRGQNVIGSIEVAAQNVVTITDTMKMSMQDVVDNIQSLTEKVNTVADKTNSTLDNIDGGVTEVRRNLDSIAGKVQDSVALITDDAQRTIGNLDSGINDIRSAVGKTIGDPAVQANLSTTITNLTSISDSIASRREALIRLMDNFDVLTVDLREVGGRVRAITDRVDPKTVADALGSMSGAIASLSEVVEKIKAEPVLALSVNKAADRIVKMKFDELSKQPQFKTADATLEEINRWVKEAMHRGQFADPKFAPDRRPYAIN